MNNLITYIFFGALAIWLSGCASRVVPTGGIKDEIAPKLIKATPENNAVNFTNNKVTLTFDEYIQLKDMNDQLVISPPILPKPKITALKKSIIIEFEESLKINTTYTINFGNSIIDIHEDNPISGFRYVFSTGSELDSLNFSGKTIHALNLKPVSKAFVLLYSNTIADSLILKSTPEYFTRTDDAGNFTLENLKSGSYKMYALYETNNNYIFDASDELIGFVPEIVSTGKPTNFNILLFNQYPSSLKIVDIKQPVPGKFLTVFNKPTENVTWSFVDEELDDLKVYMNSIRDTIILYAKEPVSEKLRIIWYENNITIDTMSYQKPKGLKLNENKFNFTGYETYPAKATTLKPGTNPQIIWDLPIINIDTTKIKVLKDSVNLDFTISFLDSLNTKLSIQQNWEEGTYIINVDRGAVTDMRGLQNDSLTFSITIPSNNSKGTISYKLEYTQTSNYILQLVNEKDELVREVFDVINSGDFTLLEPGNYFLRLILDENKNFMWDRGDYFTQQLPEKVIYFKDAITVRANWEVEIEWKNIQGK